MIQNKYKGCIKSVRSYRGEDADSKHYLVITKLKIRLSDRWKKVKNKESVKYYIAKLSDRDVLKEYICKTQQELQKTNEKIEEGENVEWIWDRIRTVVVNSADNCLGIKEKENKWVPRPAVH